MDTNNENNEPGTTSVTIRMNTAIHEAVKRVAATEGRSLTKQIEQICKTDQRVAELVEAEAAGVGAGA